MRTAATALLALGALVAAADATISAVHTAFTANDDELLVTWRQLDLPSPLSTMRVSWRYASGTTTAVAPAFNATTWKQSDFCAAPATDPKNWVDPGYFVSALVTGLKPDSLIEWSISGAGESAGPFNTSFRPDPKGASMVVFGDSGRARATMDNAAALAPSVAATWDLGDLAYAFGEMQKWYDFMDDIQPLATVAPFLTAVGNHDYDWPNQPFNPLWATYRVDSGSGGDCGVPFKHMFHMEDQFRPATSPGRADWNSTSWWWVRTWGPFAMVTMSTEHDFLKGSPQWNWADKAMARIDRSKTPFLLLGMHRPLYDTTASGVLPEEKHLRDAIEPLAERHNVTLILTAHVHNYQRTCRVYDGVCTEGVSGGPRGRPVLVVGGGGKTSGPRAWVSKPNWVAARTESLGFGLVQALNGTHMQFSYMANQAGGGSAVADQFVVSAF